MLFFSYLSLCTTSLLNFIKIPPIIKIRLHPTTNQYYQLIILNPKIHLRTYDKPICFYLKSYKPLMGPCIVHKTPFLGVKSRLSPIYYSTNTISAFCRARNQRNNLSSLCVNTNIGYFSQIRGNFWMTRFSGE